MAVEKENERYFGNIDKVKYEGPTSDNPLAFKWYDADKVVAGKRMEDHFRFATAYWHSFNNNGSDPFGEGTHLFPWNKYSDPLDRAYAKADAAFDFIEKLGTPFFCFHDVDIVDLTNDIVENERRLDKITDYIKQKQSATGTRLLWGTSNLFTNKRYMNGAATNPDFNVLAHAAAQVKGAIDATIKLGGENYVFWAAAKAI